MRLLRSVLLAALFLPSSVYAANNLTTTANQEATNFSYRDRMIEICPCDANKPMKRNVLGDVGEGNTFNSYFPALTVLCDASDNVSIRLLLESGNEQVEFSQKYKFLSKIGASCETHSFLRGLIDAAGKQPREDNKRYFDIVKSLEEYGKRYFYFEGKSPNLLVVSIKLLGAVEKEIFLGVFVSGGDSCKLLIEGKDVSSKKLTDPLEKLTFKEPEKLLKQMNSQATVFRALSGKLDEYKDLQEYHDYQNAIVELNRTGTALKIKIIANINQHRVGLETFSHAPTFEFIEGGNFKLFLSPVSGVDLNVQPSDLYKRLTKIFLDEEFDDLAKLAEYADSAKKIEAARLVDHRLIDAKDSKDPKPGDRLPFKEKGCLHSGLTDCFSDSEQAFLSYLEHVTPQDMMDAPVHINKEMLATPLCEITQVELRLLSTKDICKFCRATLSKSLASSILRDKLREYLKSQGIIDDKELTSNIPITIFGYSRVAISNTRS